MTKLCKSNILIAEYKALNHYFLEEALFLMIKCKKSI